MTQLLMQTFSTNGAFFENYPLQNCIPKASTLEQLIMVSVIESHALLHTAITLCKSLLIIIFPIK